MTTATAPMDVPIAVPVAAHVEIGGGFETGAVSAGRYLVARPVGAGRA